MDQGAGIAAPDVALWPQGTGRKRANSIASLPRDEQGRSSGRTPRPTAGGVRGVQSVAEAVARSPLSIAVKQPDASVIVEIGRAHV